MRKKGRFFEKKSKRTKTANNFNSQARIFIPLDNMKSNKSGTNRLIKVIVLDRVIVDVARKYALIAVAIGHVLPLKRVQTKRDHVGRDPLSLAAASLRDHARDFRRHAHVYLQPFGIGPVFGTPCLARVFVQTRVLLVTTLIPLEMVCTRRTYLPVLDLAI